MIIVNQDGTELINFENVTKVYLTGGVNKTQTCIYVDFTSGMHAKIATFDNAKQVQQVFGELLSQGKLVQIPDNKNE